jgi:hypothetical protein
VRLLDIRRSQPSCFWRYGAQTVLILLVVLAGFGGPSTGRALDDATEPPSETATSTATIATPLEVGDVEALTPTAEPATEPAAATLTPTVEPTPTATPTPSVIPTEISEPEAATTVTAQPEATPEMTPAALGYALAPESKCKPAPEQAEEVASGGFVDYDCTMDVQLSGKHLDPAEVRLNWRVEAVVENGWQVQLLPPAVDPNVEPQWTEITTEPAKFRHESEVGDPTTQDDGSFTATEKLSFGLRLHRSGCGAVADPVKLKVTAKAETPHLDDVAIERLSPKPEPFLLNPPRAAVPDPVIAFGGALDFGTVEVTAGGPTGSERNRTVSLTITGLDLACGDWIVTVSAQTLGSSDGSRISASYLTLTGIDGQALPDGGCDLDLGCDIAVLHAPATDAATATYTLDITLALPEQPQMGAFGSTLSAWMTST